jgi:dynein heavy chain
VPADKGSAQHNPYNLRIVPHAEVDQEDFYTMSASGVTHFVNGVAEFTPLDQWKREYELFEKVINISLFSKYKMWKSYYLWRKNVRSRRMANSQHVLMTNLFILNNNLRTSLLKIRDICHEISKLSLYVVEEGRAYTLEQFYIVQNENRDFLQERLEYP